MSLLKKITQLFEAETAAEVKFADVKTDGGLLLRITGDIAIDSPIQQINEDGSLSDLADGDYTLEDGTTIAVLGGKIAEVATAEEEAVDANEGEMATETPTEVPAETQLAEAAPAEAPAEAPVSSVEDRIAALEAKIAEVIDALNKMADMHNNMSTENVELKKQNEELSKKAAAPAVSFKKFEKSESNTSKPSSMLEKVLRAKK